MLKRTIFIFCAFSQSYAAADWAIENACLPFNDAMAIAAQRDPSVDTAYAQRLEADAELIDARSLYKPQISTFARTGSGDVGLVDSVIQNQVGLRTSQRVLDFGDAKFARRAAQLELDASDQDIQQARLLAARDTGLDYLSMLEAQEQIEAVNQRAGFYQQQLTALDTLLPSGGATISERAEVAAQFADAQAQGLELEFQYEQAFTRVELSTGLVPIACPDDTHQEQLNRMVARLDDPDEARQIALAESPLIEALDKRAHSLDANYQRTKRNRFPIINVVSLNSFAGSDGSGLELQDRVGLDVSIPLFNGNAGKARRQRAQAQARRAKSQLSESRRQLEQQVSITHRRITSLQAQLRSRKLVEQHQQTQFNAIETEYHAGARTLPELVDARLGYEDALLTRIRLKYELQRRQVELLALTGRLPVTTTSLKTFYGP